MSIAALIPLGLLLVIGIFFLFFGGSKDQDRMR